MKDNRMGLFDDKQLDELYEKYVEKHGDEDNVFGAVLYSFGYDKGAKIIKKANDRKIRIYYGKGLDEIKRVVAIDQYGNRERIDN